MNSLETTALISEQSASPVEAMIYHQTFMVDDIYEEIISKRASLSRSVENFENYVKEAIGKGLLQSQFKVKRYTLSVEIIGVQNFVSLAS